MNANREGVLLVTSSFPRWANDDATGRFMIDVAIELNKSFDVTVLAPWTQGALASETMEGVRVYRHKQTPFNSNIAYGSGMLANIKSNPVNALLLPFFFLYQFTMMARLVRRHNVSVINPHWIVPQGFLAVFYKKFFNLGTRVVATAHGTDVNGLNGAVGTWMKKFTLRGLDGLTVVSAPLADRVRALGYAGPITIAPMGVNTEKFSPARRSDELKRKLGAGPVIVYAGALLESKGLRDLVDAMPNVLLHHPEATLHLIGEGDFEPALKARVEELKITKSVAFPGPIDHRALPSVLASADVFVQPSYAEGFSVIVAEALACELPVIMTEKIGIADAIDKLLRASGARALYTVPPRQHFAISAAIREILGDRVASRNVGAFGRKIVVENYSWPVIGEKYRKAFQVRQQTGN